MQRIIAQMPETSSLDVTAHNIEELKRLFPEASTENGIDFEVLKQVLGSVVDDREEKWGLNWHGKRKARQAALTSSSGTLRPSFEESMGWETTENLVVEGDNLEVLKLLQKAYHAQVKMIYIDPPYNTGNDFIYPDDFAENLVTYLQYSGQADDSGRKFSTNTESSGRFHSKWLSMMYPRLFLARNLLSEDGVIFISIDDHEQHHLRCICNEIFGEENLLAQFTWRTDGNFDNQAKVKRSHEYIIAYCKNIDEFPHPPVVDPSVPSDSKLFRAEIRNTIVKNGPKNPVSKVDLPIGFPAAFENGIVKARKDAWPHYDKDAKIANFALTHAVTVSSGWSSRELLDEFIKSGFAGIKDGKGQETRFVISPTGAVEVVKQRSDCPSHVVSSLSNLGGPQKAAKELDELGVIFDDYAKPTALMKYLISMVGDRECIVMDFFAGSATTAQATWELNKTDGGNRKFIMVQLPERCPEHTKAFAAGYKTISEISIARLRKYVELQKNEREPVRSDLGFRVFKLDSSNIRAWEPDRDGLSTSLLDAIEHIKSGRGEQDILYELLLKLGVNLTVPINQKTIAGKQVYSVGSGVLLVCLAEKIGKPDLEDLAIGIADWYQALAPTGEVTCVFRDSAFVDDVAKTNFTAILQQRGLENIRSL